MKAISYPNFYFHNLKTGSQEKVNAKEATVKLYIVKTKAGTRYRVGAVTKAKDKLSRFISKDQYMELKKLLPTKSKKSPKKSSKKSSKCNRSKSGKKKSKKACKKSSKTCKWVSGEKGVRKGYCRPKKSKSPKKKSKK